MLMCDVHIQQNNDSKKYQGNYVLVVGTENYVHCPWFVILCWYEALNDFAYFYQYYFTLTGAITLPQYSEIPLIIPG